MLGVSNQVKVPSFLCVLEMTEEGLQLPSVLGVPKDSQEELQGVFGKKDTRCSD